MLDLPRFPKEAGLRQLLCILLLLCNAAFTLAQKPSAIKDQLPGTWRLISIETIRPSGEIIYPFYGKHPQGLLMYDRRETPRRMFFARRQSFGIPATART